MIYRPLNSSVPNSSQRILTNSFLSSNSETKTPRQCFDKLNPKNCPNDKNTKSIKDDDIRQSQPQIEEADPNEDICFKCKKFGQLFCCDNCFRSFHWKCIGSKKIEELNKMTHSINFICQSCDFHSYCTKCYSIYPIKTNFNLIEYSDHNSILNFYKCTHCYSKIHRKCYEVPYEALEKNSFDSKETDSLPNYVCIRCLQNVGITEIIRTQRLSLNLGTQKLYFLILLNTNSPIHKGWFEEITLSQILKKFTNNQSFIDGFTKKNLYQSPAIEKIIEIRFPKKHKNVAITDVLKTMQAKNRSPISERYGNVDNFKFLVKWKQRNYTSLSWQDETIILRNLAELKRFLTERQKWNCIMKKIEEHKSRISNQSTDQQINYKVLEYLLTEKQQIQAKYLLINKEIDLSNKLQQKSFEERMQSLDAENSKESFIQIIQIQDHKASIKAPFDYMNKFVAYFQKCYLTQIILRPILIVTNEVTEWEQAIKNQKRYKSHYLRYCKFFGGKHNVNQIKRWDFFASLNPCILKFDILLLDFNYFIYEKEYLFQKIPYFFAILFDKSQAYSTQANKLQLLKQHYLPFKSKVHKEIYLVENSYLNCSVQDFGCKILRQTQNTVNQIKKSVFHTLDFRKFVRFNSSEPKLKLILNKKFTQCANIFDLSSNQILNEGQRLSFLRFILSYGLNIKVVDDICIRLKQMSPSIWDFEKREMQRMKSLIRDYIPMFVSIVYKTSKEMQQKMECSVLNYFLFGYKSEDVFRRIIKLKKLKTLIEIFKEDRSKFPITKTFLFFSSGQCKPFPLWSIYEDYTLGAMIIQEGYQRWNKLINSQKWRFYHEKLQKTKTWQLDKKVSMFIVHEKIVPIKNKTPNDLANTAGSQSHDILINSQQNQNETNDFTGQNNIKTYGDYLINKIRNSKEIQQNQYEKLCDISVLQGHIAERGDDIVNQMN